MTDRDEGGEPHLPPGDYETEYNPDGTLKGFDFSESEDEERPSPEEALAELGVLDAERSDAVRAYLEALQAFVARIATLPAGGLGPGEVIRLRDEARRLIDWQGDARYGKD